ncbi:MAG: glutaredoxin family protein [Dongiaceae bacterium]
MNAPVDEKVRVFRAPTCSNCMRVVGHLRARGVEFEDINLMTNPSALKELEEIGVKCIPVVVKGKRYAAGQDLDKIDELLGIKKTNTVLPIEEVVERIIALIKAWARFARQLPPSTYRNVTPGMEGIDAFYMPNGDKFTLSDGRVYVPHGTYYGLVGHVLRHARRVRALITDPASPVFTTPRVFADFGEPLPEVELHELLADGEAIIQCIERWWSNASRKDVEVIVNTFHGPRTVHQLLLGETYCLAQHTRQLMTLLRQLDIEPDVPIGESEYSGLQLPDNVWK